MQADRARAIITKVTVRLMPFLFCCYVTSYLDRVNVGFAALTMNREIGLSATMFGWASGLFSIGYLLFEIPSNLVMHRVGARRWIGRILITWGLASGLTIFVRGPLSFALSRFLLGVAEAGFVPGVFLYLTYWYPAKWRANATAAFMLGIPVANVVGSPMSGMLLQLDGVWGIHGWQWLLLVEALPALVLGIACLFVLADRPSNARWLSNEEKDWLTAAVETERADVEKKHLSGLSQALTNRRVLLFSLINLSGIIGSVGIGLWMPQILQSYGLSTSTVGVLSAVPYAFGGIAMFFAPTLGKLLGSAPCAVAFSLILAALGLVLSSRSLSVLPSVLAIAIAVSGTLSFQPNFWSLPPTFLTGRAAAGGIALIVSIGNLGGFLGPFLIGWLRDLTHGFSTALLAIAACLLLGAILMLIVGDPTQPSVKSARGGIRRQEPPLCL